MHRDPAETVKMIQSQQQPQLEQVVNMLDSAKDLLDQHKPQPGVKTFPNISMQTEIRWVDTFFLPPLQFCQKASHKIIINMKMTY